MPPKSKTAARTAPKLAEKAPAKPSVETKIDHQSAVVQLCDNYFQTTPKRFKLIDIFLVFLCLSGVFQFLYCAIITNYPFNTFLAGFSATIGQFVLTASLRMQVNPSNKPIFDITPETAFADYVAGTVLLHFFVFNYLG